MAGRGQLLGQIMALVGAGPAGKGESVGEHRRQRRRRLVGPNRVNRIFRQRHRRRPDVGQCLVIARQAVARVQPRVVAEPSTGRQMGLEPGGRRRVGDVMGFIKSGVDLIAHLQGVAAIGENRRRVGRHNGQSGRAIKTGQPKQAFGLGGDVFAQKLIGAGNEKTVDLDLRQARPQGRQPCRRIACRHRRLAGRPPGLQRGSQIGRQFGANQRQPSGRIMARRRGVHPVNHRVQISQRHFGAGVLQTRH